MGLLCTTFHAQSRITTGWAVFYGFVNITLSNLLRLDYGVPSPSRPPSTSAPASALSAFLRGIERRALVFALAQCGDIALAKAALANAMRSFRSVSAATPLSGWPAGFWSLLLAEPELAQGESGVETLKVLSSGPRAALLLRLVAGLDFAHASQVLGVSEAVYRYASQRALHQLGEAGLSYTGLAALRERLHRQVKTLSESELQMLAELRERVLAGEPEPRVVVAAPKRWPRRLLWAALLLLGVAFAMTFLPVQEPALPPGATQSLPVESDPPVRAPLSDVDIVTHPDYVLMQQPDAQTLAMDMALLSWLAGDPEAAAAVPDSQEAPHASER